MANLITFLRFPLLFIYIALLYYGDATTQLWCALLIAIIFFMDTVDGYIARLRGEVSLFGSALDIATDRALEIALWVIFAHLGLIPIVISLIAIVRGTLVDAIRAVGMTGGKSAFEQVRHPISRFIVSSRFMRDFYGVAKGITFILLTINLGLSSAHSSAELPVHYAALIGAWLSITLTVVRGIPVLAESYRLFQEN